MTPKTIQTKKDVTTTARKQKVKLPVSCLLYLSDEVTQQKAAAARKVVFKKKKEWPLLAEKDRY